MLTEIVKRALVETVVNIGQLTQTEKRELERAVKRGWLSKGKGGPFPRLKTVYAVPEFDFVADRQRWVDHFARLAEFDREQAQLRGLQGTWK